MHPVLQHFHISFRQVAEPALHVLDHRLRHSHRDGFGGQRVEEPGQRVAGLAVEALQGVVEGQALGAVGAGEFWRLAVDGGNRGGLQDGLAVAVQVFAHGKHPVVSEVRGVAGAAGLPSVEEAMHGLRFGFLAGHAP